MNRDYIERMGSVHGSGGVNKTTVCAMVFPVAERLTSAGNHALTVFFVPLLPKPLLLVSGLLVLECALGALGGQVALKLRQHCQHLKEVAPVV